MFLINFHFHIWKEKFSGSKFLKHISELFIHISENITEIFSNGFVAHKHFFLSIKDFIFGNNFSKFYKIYFDEKNCIHTKKTQLKSFLDDLYK